MVKHIRFPWSGLRTLTFLPTKSNFSWEMLKIPDIKS
jgi:hypothetical protein